VKDVDTQKQSSRCPAGDSGKEALPQQTENEDWNPERTAELSVLNVDISGL